jgi:hypothetical protein
MENRTEYIDKMVIKLKVLESRIQKLESIANEVLDEVKSEYQQQIKELYQKKEAAQLELLKIQETTENNI